MVDKVKVSDIAKELGMKSKEVVEKANDIGISAKAANSSVTQEDAEGLINFILTGAMPKPKEKKAPKKKVQDDVKKTPKKTTSKTQKDKVEKSKDKVIKEPKSKPDMDVKTSKKDEIKAKTSPKKELKKEEPKEDLKKEFKKEVKKEPKKEESKPKKGLMRGLRAPNKETLAQASVKNRRGLVIVKKRKPIKKKEEVSYDDLDAKLSAKTMKKAIPTSLEAMFSGGDSEVKKKKKAKKLPTSKKNSAEKLDLMGGDFGDSLYDHEDDMVVLPDLTIKPEPEAPKPALKKRKDSQVHYRHNNQGNTFQNQGGIGRSSRRRRKKPVEKVSAQEVSSIEIPEEIRVYEFAEKLGRQSSEIISKLFR